MENKIILKRLYNDYTKKFLPKILLSVFFSLIVAGSTAAIAWLLDPAIKKIFIDKTFNEIPSSDIENSKKQKWLEDIIKMDKKELPQKIIDWEKAIFDKVLTAEKNTVIFSHFMVINSIVSNLIKSNSIFYFYPDNTSITKIFLEKGKVVSFQIGNDKKTHINL